MNVYVPRMMSYIIVSDNRGAPHGLCECPQSILVSQALNNQTIFVGLVLISVSENILIVPKSLQMELSSQIST